MFLWNLGIVSLLGWWQSYVSVCEMQGSMHDFTVSYLKKAFFDPKIGTIESASEWDRL